MNARVKFLFDDDFAPADPSRPGAGHVAEAEARGYREGLAAGKAQAQAETERQLATALARSAEALHALASGLRAVETRMETESVAVAVSVARKLAATLIEREPLAEIEALAVESFRHLVGAPHVVVRVNDAVYDAARARLTEIAERVNFGGRLIMLADPECAAGDCRIEWADGGTARSRAAIESAIVDAVERYLAAGSGAPLNQNARSSMP